MAKTAGKADTPPLPLTTNPPAQAAIVRLVAGEAFDAALDVAGSACSDVRKAEAIPAFPALTPATWPEVARRLMLLAGNARLVAVGAACGGGDSRTCPVRPCNPLSTPAARVQCHVANT